MIQLVNRDLHSAVDGRRAVAGTRTRFGSPGIRKSIWQQVPPSSRPGLGLAGEASMPPVDARELCGVP